MPVTSVSTDPESLTMTLIADFAAPVERLWEAYADPRQIERFWGPEGWPATFTRHDFAVGGRSHYYMTGPDGEQFHGLWEYLEIEPHARVAVHDKFASSAGVENPDMPTLHMTLSFEATEGGSRLTTVTTFSSIDALNEVVAMGAVEGAESSMGQLDQVLADLESFAAGRGVDLAVLSDTQVRISRVIRGSVEQVWQAHHEPELLKRWLLCADGWTMPVCELAGGVGETYRFEWEPESGDEEGFGFTGELLASDPPLREVTTESMIGIEGEPNVKEMTLTPVDAGTLLTLVTTYPSEEVRDIVLATDMMDGMETSYARLDGILA